MLNIKEKTKCCGCGACAQICSKNAIAMQSDSEGFLYPVVDKNKCIKCGLCVKTCPILNKPVTYRILRTYAAKHKSNDIKLKSSSGGIFTALAETILKNNGVVFGAAFDKDWNVVHTYVDNLKDLDKLRRSKYVQSDTAETFKQTKEFLEKGKQVLYAGTSCQIAGLRNFLGKDYDNLLTVDIICHAVPSPAVWQKFLKENLNISKIKAINFREKDIGWSNFYLSFLTPHGLNAHGKNKTLLEALHFKLRAVAAAVVYRNTYLKAFLTELINRPSCHECYFKGITRLADFTLGDLWGIWPGIIKRQDKKYGISVCLVNTEKGIKYFTKVNTILSFQHIALNQVAKFNSALIKSTEANPKRKEFFVRYKTENFNKLVKELLKLKPLWLSIPHQIVGKFFGKIKILWKRVVKI